MDDKRYNIPELSGINENALNDILENRTKNTNLEALPEGEVGKALDTLVHGDQDQFPQFDEHNGVFSQSTKLYKICLEILNKIYCAGAVRLTWRDVEQIITSTTAKLEKWKSEVPADLFPPHQSPEPDLQVQRKKLLLYLDYLNTVILLNWPCLCRVKAVEAAQSRPFNRAASVACVTAALEIIKLLPDDIRPADFWNVFPWWIILYYIVSSGMIVMMEMTLQAEHIPEQKDQLMMSGEKLLRWLNYMGQNDLAARRSCKMLTELMITAAPHIGRTYEAPPEFAESQVEQQVLGPEHPGFVLGSSELFAGSSQEMQGFDPFLGGVNSMGELSDSSQPQTLLGVPGINILARTGFDNIGLLSSFPFQTIADDANAGIDPMQLGNTGAPPMWNWQSFPVQPSHSSESHTPAPEFPSQMYPIGSGFTPGYSGYGESNEGYQDSEVEVQFAGTPPVQDEHQYQ
ncbi:hypothetical protein ABW20_dc0105835 [Dactylellina cionopaga]|nr:hypothetical protein ABW20_dc0105835 [Dactylellina cionopaga]